MKIGINAISYYLPDNVLLNEELSANFPEWSSDSIQRKTGICQRHISNESESTSDLAIKAVNSLITNYNINKQYIDFIITCTQTPDYLIPTTACIIQDRLGLSKSCGALDINLGCSGYVYGLSLAKGLIHSDSAKNILLITSDTITKFIHNDDKGNRSLFGDAASATLLTSDDNSSEIGKFCFGTDGSGYDNIIIKNGGSKNRVLNNKTIKENNGFIKNDDYFFMNGKNVFQFVTKNVPKLINEVLEINKINKDEVDLFVLHQANKQMLDYIRVKMNLPKDKFFIYLDSCGNTYSSSIPIALNEAIIQGKITKGSRVLLAGFGVGYSYSAVIVDF